MSRKATGRADGLSDGPGRPPHKDTYENVRLV
jgi:hypothetical protein